MDDGTKRLLRRLIRRIPAQQLKVTLEKWGRLTAAQQRALDGTSSKWALAEKLIEYDEVSVKCLK